MVWAKASVGFRVWRNQRLKLRLWRVGVLSRVTGTR